MVKQGVHKHKNILILEVKEKPQSYSSVVTQNPASQTM